ncbi:FCS-Like Zinc finger 10 [Andrographis paniculata]|uniref:FCS-Like Zinc finger 10 n=1 Tax=Andrographis paniculata TaxID=175694 RepID=UPI0021E91765|nr:FCS-Like Zinc finger 10 [Andrographis paniculata]
MLRKRARSYTKNQSQSGTTMPPISTSDSYSQSDVSIHNYKGTSVLKVPGLFVGIPGSSEFDSVRSPTSTLDYRTFSGIGIPFRLARSSQNDRHLKPWDCTKVGLSIVDSLDDEAKELGNVTRLFRDGKNIVFERKMSIRSPVDFVETPKSLPANLPAFRNSNRGDVRKGNPNVVFEIGGGTDEPEKFHARSLDSGTCGSRLSNFKRSFVGSMPTSEIELSEDYTCVRIHGSNPKVTHIFGDCILECRDDEVFSIERRDDGIGNKESADRFLDPVDDFLKFCHFCRKKLDGEDIYMYRGEKSFCSYDCRLRAIEMDEEMEQTAKRDCPEIHDDGSSNGSSSLFIAG